jgi:hypothetical protein
MLWLIPLLSIACGGPVAGTDVAPPPEALVYGQPDAGRHSNVGALMILFSDGYFRASCSGVLVAPRVFLTAGHCVWWVGFAPHGSFGVSFGDDVRPVPGQPQQPPIFGRAIRHPGFVNRGGEAIENDLAVLLLDEPAEATPARLPLANQLGELAEGGGLRGATFTVVGYGSTELGGGIGVRRTATEGFLALVPEELMLSMNPALGLGGPCQNDSGSPNFLGGTALVASITTGGDHACRALNRTVRLDTPAAIGFLAGVLE